VRILFITHETGRTGAPMVLLHFLKWLKEYKPKITVDVVALRGGDLEAEFQQNSSLFINYHSLTKNQTLPLFNRILKKLKIYSPTPIAALLNRQLIQNDYTIIYANSVLSVPFAVKLKQTGAQSKLIAHIHELNTVIKQYVPDFSFYINQIDSFITPSLAVSNNLIEHWNIKEERLNKVYECTDVIEASTNKIMSKSTFTVGASGTVNWRKGFDLFIQVAGYIHNKYPQFEIQFVWVGKLDNFLKILVEEELKKLNIYQNVSFIGEVSNPAFIFNSFDLFLMTSREDPFPLVCIEAGMLGKPIICFQSATGTEEIIINGGGKVVPYLDVKAMALEVIEYYNNPENIKKDGKFNQSAFSKFTPQLICPQYFEIIQRVLK
jgi:glycosyltransferase involved in cell wall biosynthesis